MSFQESGTVLGVLRWKWIPTPPPTWALTLASLIHSPSSSGGTCQAKWTAENFIGALVMGWGPMAHFSTIGVIWRAVRWWPRSSITGFLLCEESVIVHQFLPLLLFSSFKLLLRWISKKPKTMFLNLGYISASLRDPFQNHRSSLAHTYESEPFRVERSQCIFNNKSPG